MNFPAGTQWNQKYEHALILNWVYIAMKKQLKSWFTWHVFNREYFCQWGQNHLLADALVVLKNTVKKKLHPAFIEVDRAESNNHFDKVPKYTAYYQSKAWVNMWWAQPDTEGVYRFPRVLVVTDRPLMVGKVIKEENVMEIGFSVITLDDARQDVFRYV